MVSHRKYSPMSCTTELAWIHHTPIRLVRMKNVESTLTIRSESRLLTSTMSNHLLLLLKQLFSTALLSLQLMLLLCKDTTKVSFNLWNVQLPVIKRTTQFSSLVILRNRLSLEILGAKHGVRTEILESLKLEVQSVFVVSTTTWPTLPKNECDSQIFWHRVIS